MSAREAPATGWRAARWLGPLLIASLALNLAGAGLLAGAALRRDRAGSEPAVTLAHAMREGPPALRAAARDAFRARAPAFAEARARVAQAQARATAVAGARHFDAAAFAAALQDARAAQDMLVGLRHAALAALVEAAPPEARAALAERMARGTRDRRWWGDRERPRSD